MDIATEPQPPDPAVQLHREIQRRAADTLRGMLPPPIDDTPEARAIRDHAALAEVASLVPASPAEARLAANHVAAMDHASDCLRQVGLHAADPRRADQFRAQAASMGREARGYFNALVRLQVVRKKREADDPSREAAAWTEHRVLNEMTQALESLPPAPPPPAAAVPPPPAPAAAAPAKPPEKARPRDYSEWSDEEKRIDRLRAAAGRYAILNTQRVKLIRQLGGLPPDCDYEPPDPELLHEIINGNGSNLRWADSYEPWVPPA